ncbi:hypothetical protein HH212_14570 [Massilia forsythiae]|uniref:Uncharacterized protein n=1 Tax=Massilia forsythiae TaxID=2728020 RepID=A0A7Z2ZT83_9BURK|nr:hypothetical protein [Massilia forsythiae]QJE01104.1 hypothetical protein HH212_14570 [Massilia forsythiae]
MSRTADSTIKGFLYQFNKTIVTIATSDLNSEVTVEGLIEDIDVKLSSNNFLAIQCKYHESADSFNESLIFKPLLQMAEAFSHASNKNIAYKIFLHVPGETYGQRPVSTTTLDNALATKDVKLKKIVNRINPIFNKSSFLNAVNLDFGPSIDELEEQAKLALSKFEIKNSDVDSLLYPNSIAHIAKLSSLKKVQDRRITKSALIEYLSKINLTLISKWALASKTRDKILAAARKQLLKNLGQNSRERFFYFIPSTILDFESQFVIFASEFIAKYHSKPTHIKTPLIALDCDLDTVKIIQYRLFKKGIRVETGIIGDTFEMSELFKEPLSKSSNGKISEREFDLRLCTVQPKKCPLNYRKSDDLFCVNEKLPSHVDTVDVSLHHFDVSTIKELSYLFHLREDYE